eukprot:TRINITY_DN22270_c0_g1_i1.p1 TRINITY_DN22270_c0_g1~~TRINITY_DN22270_c0_g1_i1.p1  ORF type:complete len:243 (+),score=36.42 TRINITY_DN22270_c0_g1_i1:50-730(+)
MAPYLHSAICSREKACRFEGKTWPDLTNLRGIDDKLSDRRKSPKYGVPQSPDASHVRELKRSQSGPDAFMGPGQYRTHRHFPEGKDDEHRFWTSPNFQIKNESRFAKDGALKGVSTTAGNKKTNPLGPGEYPITKGNTYKHAAANYSFTKGVESQEDLRVRKSQAGKPPIGTYELSDPFKEAGKLRLEQSHRLPAKSKKCAWPTHFSHIFSVMKPNVSPDFERLSY